MKVIKILLADLLFVIGHRMVVWSAILMDYPDVANSLKKTRAHWLVKGDK